MIKPLGAIVALLVALFAAAQLLADDDLGHRANCPSGRTDVPTVRDMARAHYSEPNLPALDQPLCNDGPTPRELLDAGRRFQEVCETSPFSSMRYDFDRAVIVLTPRSDADRPGIDEFAAELGVDAELLDYSIGDGFKSLRGCLPP